MNRGNAVSSRAPLRTVGDYGHGLYIHTIHTHATKGVYNSIWIATKPKRNLSRKKPKYDKNHYLNKRIV